MKTKKRIIKKRRTALVVVFLLGLYAYLGTQIASELIIAIQTQENLKVQQDTNKRLKIQKKKLAKQKQNFSNTDYLEAFYRGQCLLTKEGEQIFKFD